VEIIFFFSGETSDDSVAGPVVIALFLLIASFELSAQI